MFVVAFTTWFYSFSAYNYYFDRLYIFDRLLLVFCFILLFRTPKILPLFILLTVLWVTQFSHPLGNNSITDKKIIYEMMIVFLSYLSINSLKKINLKYFWVIIFALIGTNYFIPGLHKLIISPNYYEWITENQISNLVLNAHSRDWLTFISDNNFLLLVSIIKDYNIVITVSTIILEISGLFILNNRKLTIFLLLSFIIFHIIIFLTSGVFFWKWILFNLCIYFLLLKYKNEFKDLYNNSNRILVIILISLSPIIFNPVWLGWWDININNTFKYYTKINNEECQISGNLFKPYEQLFTFSWHIKDFVNLKSNYYKLYLADYKMLEFSKAGKDIIRDTLENSLYKSTKRKKIFDKFISKFLKNKIQNNFLDNFHISHIWTNKYLKNEVDYNNIDNLIIRHKMYYFNETNIQNTLIDTIVYEFEK